MRAGGLGLMASCDLVVVASTVTFALTEVRIGVAPAIISVPILKRVPAGKIAAAMLTGETFDAEHARDIGLVTHVTDDVPGTVASLCRGVLAGSPKAVAETKRLLPRRTHPRPQHGVRRDAIAQRPALRERRRSRGHGGVQGEARTRLADLSAVCVAYPSRR